MAINYIIQAQIIDISADIPKAEDVFLVDTNVWYWTAYPSATCFMANQLNEYPGYLNKALFANAKIHHSGLSLAELAHLIEKTERDIYEKAVRTIRPKEYRHNLSDERVRIVSQIQAVWAQVENLADPLPLTIESSTANAALKRMQTEKVDGYDLFILESMKKHGVVQMITDDGDFVTVPGIQIFTANRNVINIARNQGKLVMR